ncbi:MAG TPA: GGDEF domain-containing protein [Vicinamibacterales bacterium]|jgi:diguanylate cyclase (GGDEF)-like protein|nr:GGDEF domain-containing protein [Vicinamibacterales bacterium]
MIRVAEGAGGFADEGGSSAQNGLRRRVSGIILSRVDLIAADAAAIFPFGAGDTLDAAYCLRIARALVTMLGQAVRDGHLDPRGSLPAGLHRTVLERTLTAETLFAFAYLAERTAIDELALDQSIGATTEPWPMVAQIVRRASFDLLGAYSEHAQSEPSVASVTDRLTTLYSRPVFDAALGKAIDRAGRFGDAISIILFDVDRLSDINNEYGYGVGDRVLERMGILIKGFFRQHDWIARYSEDAIAVILSRTVAEDAMGLAARVCATVAERLEFLDHRTEKPVKITLSAGVVNIAAKIGDVLDAERIMSNVEMALARAKTLGRSRVESFDAYSRSS